MIVSFTDFGPNGPYLGQMMVAAIKENPTVRILDLVNDAPAFRPDLAGYLLAALLPDLPLETVVLGVIDPGVGSSRRPVVVHTGGRWLVGPDNGLFAPALSRFGGGAAWQIHDHTPHLSASFHGRDLFAPAAAHLADSHAPSGVPIDPDDLIGVDAPADKDAVIYIDGYGNVMTGRRADTLPSDAKLHANGYRLAPARTFSEVLPGTAMWYRNAIGLAELAVNQGHADEALGLSLGTPLSFDHPASETPDGD